MPADEDTDTVNSIQAKEKVAGQPLMSEIDPPKVLDLIINKQTQYYTLWGVYTVVQLTAGSFGDSSKPLSPWVGLAVLFGVWTFNFGHLGFVLTSVDQLNKLSVVMNAALGGDKKEYQCSLRAFKNMQDGILPWKLWLQSSDMRSYRMNSGVHLFIDTMATLAMLFRVDYTSIHNTHRYIIMYCVC